MNDRHDNQLSPPSDTTTAADLLAVLKGLQAAISLLGKIFQQLTWPMIFGLLGGAGAWQMLGVQSWPTRATALACAGVGFQIGLVVQRHWRRLLRRPRSERAPPGS